jgi:hypothetical protein
LAAESAIRQGLPVSDAITSDIDPYWADLIRLLQVFEAKKHRKLDRVRAIRSSMLESVYLPFIDRVVRKLAVSAPVVQGTENS